jgi:septal ring factor EnvC (AmiA/AmiB activator)
VEAHSRLFSYLANLLPACLPAQPEVPTPAFPCAPCLQAEREAAKEADRAADKAAMEAAKEAEKAEKEAAKEAEKAAREAEKEQQRAEKEAEKERLRAEKEADKERKQKEAEVSGQQCGCVGWEVGLGWMGWMAGCPPASMVMGVQGGALAAGGSRQHAVRDTLPL